MKSAWEEAPQLKSPCLCACISSAMLIHDAVRKRRIDWFLLNLISLIVDLPTHRCLAHGSVLMTEDNLWWSNLIVQIQIQTQRQIQIRQPVVIQFYIAGGSGTRQKAQLVALSPVISETILISAGSSRCNPSAIVFIVIVVIQVQVYMQLMSQ